MPTLSRDQLFDRVWSDPVTKVAADLGLSDNGLRKICDRHDIPVPSRGYWARVHAGAAAVRPKLRRAKDPTLEEVRIADPPAVPPRVSDALESAKARLAEAAPVGSQDDGEPVEEAPKLLPTRKALERSKPDHKGLVQAKGRGVLPMTIGPASIDRALAAVSYLLRVGEPHGVSLHRKDEGAVLLADGEEVRFHIEEKTDRTPHPPTPEELAKQVRDASWHSASWTPWPKYDHSPSGKLKLVIDSYGGPGLRSSFGETRHQSLAAQSGGVIATVLAYAAYKKAERERAEIARRKAEVETKRREREQAFEERETRRAKFIGLVAEALAERDRLRTVLAHLEAAPADEIGRVKAMIAWTRRKLAETEARISPVHLDISARNAEVAFVETGGSERRYWYGREPALQLWRIDWAADEAHSVGALEWAEAAGLIGPPEPAGAGDEPDGGE